MTGWRDTLGAVLASHYFRNPVQLLGLVLIVTVAMALWSGVNTLTAQARASLERSQAAIEPEFEVLRKDDQPVTQSDFAALRRAGLCVTPRLLVAPEPEPPITLVGIDPLTAPCLQGRNGGLIPAESMSGLLEPRLWGNAETLARWRAQQPDDAGQIEAPPAASQAELTTDPEVPAGTLVGDIATVARYRELGTASLHLLSPAIEPEQLPVQYRTQITDYGIASEHLAESFLLNLDALGVLALLVAALLVRSVYVFGLSQRATTIGVLRRLGVTSRAIALALALEMLIIGIIGGSLGLIMGGEIARLFSGGLQATLSGLFGADADGFTRPAAGAWLQSLLILLIVIFWACGDQLLRWGKRPLSNRIPPAWRYLAVFAAVLSGFTLTWFGDALWQVYAGAALGLVALAILLPRLITAALGLGQKHLADPLTEWSFSEMRGLARSMTLPLTALAFAIAASIGVYSMVTSFEATFDRWLEQRLQGDIYLEPADESGAAGQAGIQHWTAALQQQQAVGYVHPVVRGEGVLRGQAVDVVAVDPSSPLLASWQFLDAVPRPWEELARGDAILLNEQLARREGLGVGDTVSLELGEASREARILAIYADYGRPTGEVLLPLAQLDRSLPQWSLSFVLSMTSAEPAQWQAMLDDPALPPIASHRQPQEIKAMAEAVFNRTFAITQALSGLTLALAGLALALIGYATFRVRQPVYTLVHVFGLSIAQVRLRLVIHAAGLATLLALLAIPLGVFLSWVLVARINPLAFGWALPFDLYPGFWLLLVAGSALLGIVVGLLMGNPVRIGALQGHAGIVLLVILMSGCSPSEAPETTAGFASLGSESADFAQPHPGMTIELPADMGPHPDHRLEWWYLTANLETEDGQPFGIQWTLFRQSLQPASSHHDRNEWDSHEMWMAHAAVSRPGQHWFAEKLARGGTGQAGVETGPFRAWLDDWQMIGLDGPADFEVRAATDDFRYRLRLERTAEAVAHGLDGFSAKSPSGQGSMYFSFADLRVSGEIILAGETFEVSGKGWFDREWSSQLLSAAQHGWDWFSIHLNSGAKLMVFQLRGDQPFFSGTLVTPDDRVIPLAPDQIHLQAQRIRTTPQGQVPVAWRLSITDHQIDLEIDSWPGNYWNIGAYPYWEGPITVAGSHQGDGFLEMTGYADP